MSGLLNVTEPHLNEQLDPMAKGNARLSTPVS